jgi:hypothetical protein
LAQAEAEAEPGAAGVIGVGFAISEGIALTRIAGVMLGAGTYGAYLRVDAYLKS